MMSLSKVKLMEIILRKRSEPDKVFARMSDERFARFMMHLERRDGETQEEHEKARANLRDRYVGEAPVACSRCSLLTVYVCGWCGEPLCLYCESHFE